MSAVSEAMGEVAEVNTARKFFVSQMLLSIALLSLLYYLNRSLSHTLFLGLASLPHSCTYKDVLRVDSSCPVWRKINSVQHSIRARILLLNIMLCTCYEYILYVKLISNS